MKIILYLLIFAMLALIKYMDNTMKSRYYTSRDMEISFYSGCVLSLNGTLIDSAVKKCTSSSSIYRRSLDKLMEEE